MRLAIPRGVLGLQMRETRVTAAEEYVIHCRPTGLLPVKVSSLGLTDQRHSLCGNEA